MLELKHHIGAFLILWVLFVLAAFSDWASDRAGVDQWKLLEWAIVPLATTFVAMFFVETIAWIIYLCFLR